MSATTVRRMTAIHGVPCAITRVDGGSYAAPGIRTIVVLCGSLRSFYKHACALGCEGIVSKRLGSPYRAGRLSLPSH